MNKILEKVRELRAKPVPKLQGMLGEDEEDGYGIVDKCELFGGEIAQFNDAELGSYVVYLVNNFHEIADSYEKLVEERDQLLIGAANKSFRLLELKRENKRYREALERVKGQIGGLRSVAPKPTKSLMDISIEQIDEALSPPTK